MNNISQISKAKRLTEEEVHAAAAELQESSVKVSSIEIYKFLGRGSLTTITNFLKTWKIESMETNTLPALITLPESLKKSAEQLTIKLWAESQEIAEQEIKSQREALRQAEALTNEKIAEAEAFSEEQAKQIEDLETKNEILKNEKTEDHALFLKEEKRLQTEIAQAKKEETIFEQRFIESEKQLKEIAKENNNLREKIDLESKARIEADQQSAVLTAKNEFLTEYVRKTDNETAELNKQNKQNTQELNNAKTQIQSQQITLDTATREIEDTKKQIKDARADAKKSGEAAAEMRGKLTASTEQKTKALLKNTG